MDGPDFTRIRPVKARANLPLPAEEVFAFVADPCNDPQWVEATPRVVQTDGDGPVVGATYEYDQTLMETVQGQIVITDIAAPAFVAYRVEDPLRTYRVEYRVTTKGDGCVLEQTSYPWFKNPKHRRIAWIARPMVRKQMRRQLRALKAVLASE